MKQIKKKNYACVITIFLITIFLIMIYSACETVNEEELHFRQKSPIVRTLSRAIRLRPDGTVVAIGRNDKAQSDTSKWKNIVSIAASEYHTIGLKSDGTVVATGSNQRGECNVSGWRNIVDIAAISDFTIGVKSDGSVVASGDYGNLPMDELLKWKDILSVSAYQRQIAGLKSDGTVITACLGGSKIDVPEWENIVDIAVASAHIVGLKSDGTVVAYSTTDSADAACNVSEWHDIVAIAASATASIGLKSDGTIEACGQVTSIEDNISENDRIFRLKGVTAIAASAGELMVLNEEKRIGLFGTWAMPPFTKEEFEKLQG